MTKDLYRTIEMICKNINDQGLYRYDPRDIDDFTAKVANQSLRRYISKSLQVVEVFSPYVVRRIIGSKPRIFPTTFTYLSESLYDSKDELPLYGDSTFYMEKCIDEYYKGNGFWKYHANNTFYANSNCTENPSMPLYMLARCNNLITRLALENNNSRFLQISKQSLTYVFNHHTIFKHKDETENISYYYNSIDNTINVNSELLDWMCQIPGCLNDEKMLMHFIAILNGILNEQNEDGSWAYFSKEHMKQHNLNPVIDCHHFATVIYNLIHIYRNVNSNQVDREELKKKINKSMDYLTNHFINSDGHAISIIGKKRKASSVQYSEALIAIIDFLRFVDFRDDYALLANKVAEILASLVKKDGSAPGDSKIVPININNINWGNGPVLYALTHFLYCYE